MESALGQGGSQGGDARQGEDSRQVRIFISYSRVDSEFVDRLQADLQVRGFDTWVDRRKIEGGQDWADTIERAIDRVQVMLVVLSPESVESEWVRKEYSYAQGQRKTVIPLHHRPVPKVPIRLNELQWVDFGETYEQGLKELLVALTAPSVTALPPAPAPAADVALPTDATPDLVVPRPAPPPPAPDLNNLYKQGIDARAAGDLERAAILWQQVLDRDPHFGNGLLATQMADLQKELHPRRVQRLREQAREASQAGDWRRVIGAYQALLGLVPNDAQAQKGVRFALRRRAEKAHADGQWGEEIGAWEALLKLEPGERQARKRIAVAEQNQEWSWLYANAQEFVKDGKIPAAKNALETLQTKAPEYGDPAGLAQFVSERAAKTFGKAGLLPSLLSRRNLVIVPAILVVVSLAIVLAPQALTAVSRITGRSTTPTTACISSGADLGGVWSLAWRPTGSDLVAVGYQYGTVQIRDGDQVVAHHVQQETSSANCGVVAVAWSRQDDMLSLSLDGTAEIWNDLTGGGQRLTHFDCTAACLQESIGLLMGLVLPWEMRAASQYGTL